MNWAPIYTAAQCSDLNDCNTAIEQIKAYIRCYPFSKQAYRRLLAIEKKAETFKKAKA